ncbi:hypothetical protein TSMEX_006754 [Taenia solium]|eukprot:TsM_000315700 transcript=TsM_000315700 gene=TsM_000315700
MLVLVILANFNSADNCPEVKNIQLPLLRSTEIVQNTASCSSAFFAV